jgi:hypothetical protein
MNGTHVLLAALVLVSFTDPRTLRAAEPSHARLDEKHRVFFTDNCVECHNEKKHKGKLRLDDISFVIDSVENADRWQKILNQLNSGEMPPEDAKQPEGGAKTEFLDSLSHSLMTARRSLGDAGGKITMRRLNRREYKNTIRDLLGVEIDARDLPADGGAGTFDTVGSSLFMSSDQLEQYLALGHKALDLVIANATAGPARTVRREAEFWANNVVRGTYEGYYKGGYDSAKAWQASDRTKPPRDFGLPDEDEVKFRIMVFETHGPSFAAYLANPLTQTGSLLTIYNIHPEEVIALPPDTSTDWDKTVQAAVHPGEYRLRLRIGALPQTSGERHFLDMGSRSKDVEFAYMRSFHITGTQTEPQVIEVPVTITADGPHSFVFREKREVKIDDKVYEEQRLLTGVGPKPALWIDWVEWEGPLPPKNPGAWAPSVTGTKDSAAARAEIERFATRAFRDHGPTPGFLDKLVKLFETRHNAGDTFEAALKEPLCVVLASPHFLYLAEPSDEKEVRALTGIELASRLSYFLWSAPPDDTLLALARSGELHKPEVLATEVDRLIANEKSRDFVNGFTQQWLGLERLDFFQFNPLAYRDFNEGTKASAKQEIFRTVEYLLRGNESLHLLLKSDFVIVNSVLASYYELEGVSGDEFRKVSLPTGSPRGGLLGMAAVLAMGSNGERTSPVERGAWVLRKLLHEPPPPAPPNVPQLARLDGKILTTRERMLAHQEEPQCASCHRKIDPIGFGLENFNAAGKWRTEDSYGSKTWSVDPAGAFHHGPAFNDYFQLRDLIAAEPAKLARGFSEALIEYALGRPCGFADEELVTRMLEQAEKKEFALREFIQALVSSRQFQSK